MENDTSFTRGSVIACWSFAIFAEVIGHVPAQRDKKNDATKTWPFKLSLVTGAPD
jgi:hypothetical protein